MKGGKKKEEKDENCRRYHAIKGGTKTRQRGILSCEELNHGSRSTARSRYSRHHRRKVETVHRSRNQFATTAILLPGGAFSQDLHFRETRMKSAVEDRGGGCGGGGGGYLLSFKKRNRTVRAASISRTTKKGSNLAWLVF